MEPSYLLTVSFPKHLFSIIAQDLREHLLVRAAGFGLHKQMTFVSVYYEIPMSNLEWV